MPSPPPLAPFSFPSAPAVALALPAGPGEVFDRRGIDRLKAARLADPAARARAAARVVAHDALLTLVATVAPFTTAEVAQWVADLDAVNAALWSLESEARALLAGDADDAALGAVARRVFGLNDRRAALKRQLDAAHGQAPGEDKGHGTDAGEGEGQASAG